MMWIPLAMAFDCAWAIVVQGLASGPQVGPVPPVVRTLYFGLGSRFAVTVMPAEVDVPNELVRVSLATKVPTEL